MVINSEYEFGEIVYFIVDPTQDEFMITGFSVRPNRIVYYVSNCGNEHLAYDFEISREKTIK